MEILQYIYSSTFLLTITSACGVSFIAMIALVIYDDYRINKPFRDIEKKYKDLI